METKRTLNGHLTKNDKYFFYSSPLTYTGIYLIQQNKDKSWDQKVKNMPLLKPMELINMSTLSVTTLNLYMYIRCIFMQRLDDCL